MSKYVSTGDGERDMDVSSRGQTKVSALAKDLASKFSGEKKTEEPKPVSGTYAIYLLVFLIGKRHSD
jgi:hypothetical protein